MQCSAFIDNFPKVSYDNTQQFTHVDEIWGAFCKWKLRLILCLSHLSVVCNAMMHWTYLLWHPAVLYVFTVYIKSFVVLWPLGKHDSVTHFLCVLQTERYLSELSQCLFKLWLVCGLFCVFSIKKTNWTALNSNYHISDPHSRKYPSGNACDVISLQPRSNPRHVNPQTPRNVTVILFV